MLSILIVQLDHIDHGELSPLPALPCGNTLGYQFNGDNLPLHAQAARTAESPRVSGMVGYVERTALLYYSNRKTFVLRYILCFSLCLTFC